ncbi:unnamed protein product [Cuscuta epithymum]|uniref:RING-type domain-containing protein n=1 Tax=Cuscuta epithymum TaxID=186058 RepID=A0AAV0GJ23_9ASTE|nr:unnamed protein product [Cuscuta epithymum]CAH9147497.1 unnamed protein product [Cuscuta epithymum]
MEKAETNNVNNNGEEVAESTTAADHSERPNNTTCNNNSVMPAPVLDENGRGEFGTDVNQGGQGPPQPSWRTPFTDLSQIDADLALARTLQEQERAYMILTMHGNGSDYVSEEEYVHDYRHDSSGDPSEVDDSHVDLDDEDAFDFHARDEASDDENQGIELDPAAFPSDEAYARALQEVEEREMTARLLALAGLNEVYVGRALSEEDHGQNSQDAWEEADPDELSYEELIALGEVVGTETRGLSPHTIASLPSMNYKAEITKDGFNDTCVICRLDYENDETLTVLSCKHSYHPECIKNWLRINKVCPVCSAEVPSSGNS